jgi:non-specific serine/threonine protein kinase
LIAVSPRLTILASSREGLGVYGEMTYHLPTSSLPPGDGVTAEVAGWSEAVQLFVERATAALPGFRLNEANAPAVVQYRKAVGRHSPGNRTGCGAAAGLHR